MVYATPKANYSPNDINKVTLIILVHKTRSKLRDMSGMRNT